MKDYKLFQNIKHFATAVVLHFCFPAAATSETQEHSKSAMTKVHRALPAIAFHLTPARQYILGRGQKNIVRCVGNCLGSLLYHLSDCLLRFAVLALSHRLKSSA